MPLPAIPALWVIVRPVLQAFIKKYGVHMAVAAAVYVFGEDVLEILLSDVVGELGEDIGGQIREAAELKRRGGGVDIDHDTAHEALVGAHKIAGGHPRLGEASDVQHHVHNFPQLDRSPHYVREVTEDPIEILDQALGLYEGECE